MGHTSMSQNPLVNKKKVVCLSFYGFDHCFCLLMFTLGLVKLFIVHTIVHTNPNQSIWHRYLTAQSMMTSLYQSSNIIISVCTLRRGLEPPARSLLPINSCTMLIPPSSRLMLLLNCEKNEIYKKNNGLFAGDFKHFVIF